jgi:hypothetical protein
MSERTPSDTTDDGRESEPPPEEGTGALLTRTILRTRSPTRISSVAFGTDGVRSAYDSRSAITTRTTDSGGD